MKKCQIHEKRTEQNRNKKEKTRKKMLLNVKLLRKQDTKMICMLELLQRVFKIATINILWDTVKAGMAYKKTYIILAGKWKIYEEIT